jgi:hypothetical protein
MILIYIIVGIVIVHALFLLYPVYRDEALDVYAWTPWTEKNYALFKKVTSKNKEVKIRLLINWIFWPFIILFILVMPIVFLFKLQGILKEYEGDITYSKDGKVLLKVAENCRRVKVKRGVEVIATAAFDSTRVVHVKLPNTVKVLEPRAFLRAHYLESINLPVSIIKIGMYAFQFSGDFGIGLKRIVLPKNLHHLGENAFYGCEKLETLTIRGDFMWKHSWLESNPFYCTRALAVIKSSNPNFKVEDGMLMSADGKILFRCVNENKRVVVKDGIETIAQGAFCGRNRMEEVVLPSSLRTICNDAFSGCHCIDNVVLPEGVESIGIESFSSCWNLKTITLPASLKNIAFGAFEHSDHLKDFVFPKGKEEEFKKMIRETEYNLPF